MKSIVDPKDTKAASSHSVLIVDDNLQDYRLMSVLINNDSTNTYRFDWARNSKEAVGKLKRANYDLVAVDFNLGLEDGSEVITQLSGLHPEIPYIMITGNQDPTVYKKGIQAGAANFVQKGQECGKVFDRTVQYAIQRKRGENSLKVANASKDWLMSQLELEISQPIFALNQLLGSIVREQANTPKEMLVELIETAYQSSCATILATKDLLEWGRSVQGSMQPSMDMMDVERCIQQTIRLLTPIADERGIYIFTKGYINFKAYCDQRMLSSVVRNLTNAAISFCAADGIVSIESKTTRTELQISMTSPGDGISPLDFASLAASPGPGNDHAPTNQAISYLRVASHLLDAMGRSLEVLNQPGESLTLKFSLSLLPPVGL